MDNYVTITISDNRDSTVGILQNSWKLKVPSFLFEEFTDEDEKEFMDDLKSFYSKYQEHTDFVYKQGENNGF